MTDTERIEQIEQYIPYFFLTRHIRIAKCKKKNTRMVKYYLEAPGIDPGTSRMQSERSTIWATPPYFQGLT